MKEGTDLGGKFAERHPGATGTGYALAAAFLFGVSIPAVRAFGEGCGPWTTAALLYGGATAAFLPARGGGGGETPVGPSHLPRLAFVSFLGAAAAPAALAWGLRRTGALSASLLLNLEVVFALVLARLLFGEPLGRRVLAGSALVVLGGAALAAGKATGGPSAASGLLAVAGAAAAWALDGVLSRPLSEADPRHVVVAKGALGAALSTTAALLSGEPLPGAVPAAALAATGALGYGLSLRYYLLALRRSGAARTSSVFASAPFIGALAALASGERPGPHVPAGMAAILLGVLLLATERHDHPHVHPPLDPEGGGEGEWHSHDHAPHRHHHRHGGHGKNAAAGAGRRRGSR